MGSSGCVKESRVIMRLKSREDAMIKTRKAKFPPILAIYLAVVTGFGVFVSSRVHVPEASAIEAQVGTATQASITL
jgi:hypothetical protein